MRLCKVCWEPRLKYMARFMISYGTWPNVWGAMTKLLHEMCNYWDFFSVASHPANICCQLNLGYCVKCPSQLNFKTPASFHVLNIWSCTLFLLLHFHFLHDILHFKQNGAGGQEVGVPIFVQVLNFLQMMDGGWWVDNLSFPLCLCKMITALYTAIEVCVSEAKNWCETLTHLGWRWWNEKKIIVSNVEICAGGCLERPSSFVNRRMENSKFMLGCWS